MERPGTALQDQQIPQSRLHPVLWRDVDFATYESTTKMKKYYEQWKQLNTKGVYVRSLKIRMAFLILLIGNTYPTPEAPQPKWLLDPPISGHNGLEFDFPPLTGLTRLEINAGYDNDRVEENIHEAAGLRDDEYFEGYLFPQFCWLIQINPGLTHLTLQYIHPEGSIGIRCLSRVISNLHHLKYLYINPVPHESSWRDAFETVFLSIPESVETLLIKPGGESSMKEKGFSLMPKQGDMDVAESAFVLRNDPLLRLKKLSLPVEHSGSSTYQWMMDHCPNIETLGFLFVESNTGFIRTLAPAIQEYCHRIHHVLIRQELSHGETAEVFHLLEGLSAPIETLYFERYKTTVGYNGNLAIQRHASTLSDIRLIDCEHVDDGMIMEMLSRCVLLERLEIKPKQSTLFAKVDNLVSQKWACEGLCHLDLTICWGEFESTQPHYLKQQPGTPTATTHESLKDKERWNLLERFYRQLGNLSRLEVLDIKTINPKTTDPGTTYVTFPHLMTLGDGVQCRRAYLGWLAGLTNLRQLRGPSFQVSQPEIGATFGKAEATWLLESWKSLEQIELWPAFSKIPKTRVKGAGSVAINLLMKSKPGIRICSRRGREAGFIQPSPQYMMEIWRDEYYYHLEDAHLPTSHQKKPKKKKSAAVWRWMPR
ncbi:hypothetical protein BGX29_006970 [Mortierella sp. GBA35]|nr:hypothetical protein BGX29_006970 [Mortierella sp. GBA35]